MSGSCSSESIAMDRYGLEFKLVKYESISGKGKIRKTVRKSAHRDPQVMLPRMLDSLIVKRTGRVSNTIMKTKLIVLAEAGNKSHALCEYTNLILIRLCVPYSQN